VDLVDPRVERYADAHTTPLPPSIAVAAQYTRATTAAPQMMSALVESRLLEALVVGTGARRVLELGTFTGVGALALAERMAPGGTVVTIESDPGTAEVARRHIEASPAADRVELLVGDARRLVHDVEGPLDLVFLDAWKRDYIALYDAVVPKLGERGLIVADNVLRRGTVLEGGGDGQELRDFNEHVLADPRTHNALLTIGDGLMLVWRSGDA
jgi:caffeoyl-CoA O-methyltransferase